MQVPTGGIAREPKGRSGVTPEPTVKVWMEEDDHKQGTTLFLNDLLWNILYSRAFLFHKA